MNYQTNLSERIIFRLTPPERRALKNYAYQQDCTMTEIMRAALMNDDKFVQSVAEEKQEFQPAHSSNVVSVRRWIRQ